MDKKNILNNQKYLIKVKKNIPQKAGLGGGSMNASAIIKFFILKKILKFSKINLIRLARQIGSDVQLGLNSKYKILYSNGQVKLSTKKIKLFVMIIKPKFGCSTKKIYGNLRNYSSKKLNKYKNNQFNLIHILKLQNDLEKVVFKKYPKLKQVKSFMEALPNIQFARMTGSGSSILGYFLSKNSAINASKIFKKKYKNYWCITSKTI